jgi:hypothetical protein
MTTDVVELFKQASDLSEKDRATLAGLLIESLESERENDVEAAWIKEVERRIAETGFWRSPSDSLGRS